jgi:hypothetical protein
VEPYIIIHGHKGYLQLFLHYETFRFETGPQSVLSPWIEKPADGDKKNEKGAKKRFGREKREELVYEAVSPNLGRLER